MDEEPKKRVIGRPFPKGVSGNPKGRPLDLSGLKQLCQEKSLNAINTVEKIMKGETNKHSDKIKAAEIILDRAYGKPIQEVKGVQSDPLTRAWTKIIEKSAHVDADGNVRIGGKTKGKA